MDMEQKIYVVRRYLEGLRVNDLSVIDELISPNFVSQSKFMPSDKSEIMRDQAEAVSSIEDRELEYTYSVQGDWVVVRQHHVFRLVRSFDGHMPDGQWHAFDSIHYWCVQAGQITAYRDGEMRRLY
jgi:ketosteroid isomerase-like protein